MTKNRYVVGFTGGPNTVVYGKVDTQRLLAYVNSMTRKQARRQLKELTGKSRTIFELVPCEVEE